jgi:hypothetical protein
LAASFRLSPDFVAALVHNRNLHYLSCAISDKDNRERKPPPSYQLPYNRRSDGSFSGQPEAAVRIEQIIGCITTTLVLMQADESEKRAVGQRAICGRPVSIKALNVGAHQSSIASRSGSNT